MSSGQTETSMNGGFTAVGRFRAEIDRINRGAGNPGPMADTSVRRDDRRIDREAIAGRHHRSAN